MLTTIRSLLQIAPPATPLQDFTYHWKQLMNFYVNHLTNCKVPIQTTGIPRHLDRLLEILLDEEQNVNEPGPCLEYLLQHKLLDLLATLASAETPPGMRTICLAFLRKLLGRSKYPLLHHTSIYGPVQRLIDLCNGNPPSPMEAEEVQFLLTLCFLVCKYPHVTNIINDAPAVQRQTVASAKNPERIEVEKVTYIPARKRNSFNPLFEPLDTQAVTLINPNLFSSENERRRSAGSHRSKAGAAHGSSSQSNESVSSRDAENVSQSSSPSTQKSICDPSSNIAAQNSDPQDYEAQKCEDTLMNEIDTHLQNLRDLRLDAEYAGVYDDVSENDQSLLRAKTPQKSKCLLLDALSSYINTAVSKGEIRDSGIDYTWNFGWSREAQYAQWKLLVLLTSLLSYLCYSLRSGYIVAKIQLASSRCNIILARIQCVSIVLSNPANITKKEVSTIALLPSEFISESNGTLKLIRSLKQMIFFSRTTP